MYTKRMGVSFWTASLIVLAAVAVFATPSVQAFSSSQCESKLMNDIMKRCATMGTRHKRSVENYDANQDSAVELVLTEASDLPIQTFEADSNTAYVKRQLQPSDSDVAMPMANSASDPNNARAYHGPNPEPGHRHHRAGVYIPHIGFIPFSRIGRHLIP